MRRDNIRENEVAFCGDVKSWTDALFADYTRKDVHGIFAPDSPFRASAWFRELVTEQI